MFVGSRRIVIQSGGFDGVKDGGAPDVSIGTLHQGTVEMHGIYYPNERVGR